MRSPTSPDKMDLSVLVLDVTTPEMHACIPGGQPPHDMPRNPLRTPSDQGEVAHHLRSTTLRSATSWEKLSLGGRLTSVLTSETFRPSHQTAYGFVS
jgi:hypothetical protein